MRPFTRVLLIEAFVIDSVKLLFIVYKAFIHISVAQIIYRLSFSDTIFIVLYPFPSEYAFILTILTFHRDTLYGTGCSSVELIILIFESQSSFGVLGTGINVDSTCPQDYTYNVYLI